MTSSTVSKLAEARRTTYLSGRWVCDDHNGDTSISIAGPWITLPNNGDYSAYYNWVEEKKTTQGPGKGLADDKVQDGGASSYSILNVAYFSQHVVSG